jgi:hypothetical protein
MKPQRPRGGAKLLLLPRKTTSGSLYTYTFLIANQPKKFLKSLIEKELESKGIRSKWTTKS